MEKPKLYIADVNNVSYAKAIKAKCADCSGGEPNGVRDCNIARCQDCIVNQGDILPPLHCCIIPFFCLVLPVVCSVWRNYGKDR